MTETPSTQAFVHLRVHSEFSVVDGIGRIPELVGKAVELQQPALALTDLCNLFGLIKFYKAARKAGVKPIAGSDVWLENEHDREQPHRLLLLVKNDEGYLALCSLLSRARLENQYKGRAEIKREWLEGQAGLIVLSGGRMGDVGQLLASGKAAEARDAATRWARAFPDHYYLELQRTGAEGDETYVQAAMRLAVELGIPV